MDANELRKALKVRLRELGISAREASRRAGFNPGYIGNLFERPRITPDAEHVLRLADALEMDAVNLLGESTVAELRSMGDAPFKSKKRIPEHTQDSGDETPTVPLYSAPLPSLRQFVPFHKFPVGRVVCRPDLLGVRGFAAVVPNNSNAPRFFAGETIYMNPVLTPGAHDFVWIARSDDSVAIGELLELGAESLRMRFLALPGADHEAEVAYSEIKSMAKIVGIALK